MRDSQHFMSVTSHLKGEHSRLLILLSALTIGAGGCGGCDGEAPPLTTVPTVTFLAPMDGATLDAGDDANLAIAGVQPQFRLSVADFTQGVLTLSASNPGALTPNDSVELTVSTPGEVTISDLTVLTGSNNIKAELRSQNGVLLAISDIAISLEAGAAAEISIASPSDGASISPDDDTDSNTQGIQIDVAVALDNTASGSTLALTVNGQNAGELQTESETASFTGVTLPEGSVTLTVTIADQNLSDTVVVQVEPGTQDCTLTVEPGPSGGACDFTSEGDEDPDTEGIQATFTATTDCDFLRAEVNGDLQFGDTITPGEPVEVQLTLLDGENDVTISAATVGSTSATFQESYTIDIVTPTAEFFFPEDGNVLSPESDLDDNPDNGVNINVTALVDDTEGEAVTARLLLDGETLDTQVVEAQDRVTFSNVALLEGEHTLRIELEDSCANASGAEINLRVLRAQSVIIATPENGTEYGPDDDLDSDLAGLQQNFSLNVVGHEEGAIAFVECRRANGQAFFRRSEDVTIPEDGVMQVLVSLPDGAYACRARVDSPQLTSDEVFIAVSLVRETVTITQPSEGALLNTPSVTVSARTANLLDGQLAKLQIDTSEQELTARIQDNGVVFENVALSPGPNTLTVSVEESQRPSDTLTVTLDVEAPTVTFVSPSQDTPTITAADDLNNNLDDGVTANIDLRVDGAEAGTEVCVAADGASPSCGAIDEEGLATVGPLELATGEVTLRAAATDASNNEGSATLVVDVAVDRPTLRVTSPPDGGAISEGTTDVSVETDLALGTEVSLLLNGSETPVATATVDAQGGVTFAAVELIEDQENTLIATASDARGLGVSPTARVLVDTSIPTVNFTSPLSNAVFSLADEDADGVPGFQTAVSLLTPDVADGQPARLNVQCGDLEETYDSEVGDGAVNFDLVTLANDSTCSLTATVTNRANVDGGSSIEVRVDRTAPSFVFQRLQNGEVINTSDDEDLDTEGVQLSARINFDGIESGRTLSLSGGGIDETIQTTDGNQVVFSSLTLPNGELTLTISGTDAAGNEGQTSLDLFVDSSPFALSFFNIPNPATLNADDDLDIGVEGLQADISAGGVPGMTGSPVKLCSDSAPLEATACSTGGFREIAQGELATELASVVFSVTLSDGSQTLITEATVDEQLVVSQELILEVDNVRPEITSFTLTSDSLEPFGVINALEDGAPGVEGTQLLFTIQSSGAAEGRPARLFQNNVLVSGGVLDQDGAVQVGLTIDEEGEHTIEADVFDGADNGVATRSTLTFSVDVTAPSVTFTNTSEGQSFNADDDADTDTEGLQRVFTASSDAEGRSVRLVRVVGQLDAFGEDGDDEVLASAEVFGGLLDFPDPLTIPNGTHTLALRTSDAAGNVATQTLTVNVDVEVPAVAITAPTQGEVFTQEPPQFALRPGFQIEVEVSSDTPLAAVEIFDANLGLRISDDATLDSQGQATVVVTLNSGATALEARVLDGANNQGISTPVNVSVDIEGCGIVFSAPAQNPLFVSTDDDGDPDNGVRLAFTTAVGDIQTCLGQDVELFVDDVEISSSPLTDSGEVTFSGLTFASPGSYRVLAQIDDGQGNITATTTLTVNVDINAPSVSVVSPSQDPARFGQSEDSSLNPGLQADLGLRVDDAVGGTITVTSDQSQVPIAEAVPVTAQDMTLAGLTFPEGEQVITVTVTDIANSTAETSVNFEVDLTPPTNFQASAAVTNRRLGTTDLVWVAPGDDGFEGFVTRYEVRRATSVITDANFDQATLIEEVAPQVAAQQEESYTVAELPWNPPLGSGSVTHYLAVVGFDDLDNRTLVGDNIEVTLELAESRFSGQGAGNGFGFNFGSVGDLNNDGRDEMVVAQLDFGNDAAHLIYGTDDLDALDGEAAETQILTGSHAGFGFIGGRAAALGDINGDNIDDMAISAYFGNAFRGTVYIYFGVDGGQLSGDPDVVIDGLEGSAGNFGFSVGSAGNFSDVADEGIADLIVGANSEGGAGAAYVLLGRTSWDSNITVSTDEATNEANLVVRFNSDVAGGEFGYASAPLSDLNSDGFNEVAIAARGVNNQNGVVSIFTGGALSNLGELQFGQDDQQILPPSTVEGGLFGSAIASADFDGDEVLDLVINAYAGNDAISVYLFDQGVPSDASETWFTPTAGLLYGEQLAVGDINADGSPDIVAGGFSETGNGRLDVYINESGTFGGNPSLRYDRTNNWANDVTVGDFNGDGYEDVVAGQHAGSGFIVILY